MQSLKSKYCVYIYEIIPTTLLDINEDTKERLFDIYKEFFRQINFDFKIITLNRKLNSEEYINKLKTIVMNKSNSNNELKTKYLDELKIKIENENIHNSCHYIIVSSESNNFSVESVDNSLKILERMGCNVKKVKEKENIANILQSCINKD